MALYSIDSEQYVDYIPHRENFERWRSRLSEGQFEAICDELRRMIDGAEYPHGGVDARERLDRDAVGADLH